jgi:DHA1 family tetracycline resistance protein-like MFS transporter
LPGVVRASPNGWNALADKDGGVYYARNASSDVTSQTLFLFWKEAAWRITNNRSAAADATEYAKLDDASGTLLCKKGQWQFYDKNRVVSTPGVLVTKIVATTTELLGVPRQLLPYYVAFVLDAVAVGLALPLLPFYVIGLGASALQLSTVVSANYIAQIVGCVAMGKISDAYGRRLALVSCLTASALSFFCVSLAPTITSVALARVISGALGGLVPVMQSAVADVAAPEDRPKYLGRVMAAFGLGFVIGPLISTLLPTTMNAAQKIRLAACFPLLGFLIALVFAQDTKDGQFSSARRTVTGQSNADRRQGSSTNTPTSAAAPLSWEVALLVLNGFLNMFAFGTETIYAVFLKDTFGFGESVLSGLFAINGLITGVFQVFLIKPLIAAIGMPATLALGNLLLAVGMAGLAVVRSQTPHFILFGCHILGYCIADTALVSMISRHSAAESQGRDLSFNQAAQACARVASPLLAGHLYERSRTWRVGVAGESFLRHLPEGALPFLVGGLCPLLALVVPMVLSGSAVKASQSTSTV